MRAEATTVDGLRAPYVLNSFGRNARVVGRVDAQVRAAGTIDAEVACKALDLLEVDRFGLDEIDQKIMLTLLEKYSGGPVGVNTIAASIDEEPDTIEEVYEPYLIQLGFLNRTPRGRVATELAYEYFNVKPKLRRDDQPALF